MFCFACGTMCAEDANYCHICGQNQLHVQQNIPLCTCAANTNEQACEACICQRIGHYFHLGYPYQAIVSLLRKDGVSISLSTLKRRLKELGLSRRGQDIDEEQLTNLIREEIRGAGRLAGYRSIWHALRIRHGVHVPRSLVAQILKEIDPVGVDFRRSRRLTRRRYVSLGPNFCWHIDGKPDTSSVGLSFRDEPDE